MMIERAALSTSQRICLLLIGALGWLSFLGLPYEVTSLTTRFNLGGSAAGWMASAELLAVAVSAALFGRSIAKRDKRTASLLGVSIGVVGTLVSASVSPFTVVVGARILVGCGIGIIAACANATVAMYDKPERTFAQMLAMMSIVFAAVMYVVPHMTNLLGPKGFDVVESVLLVGSIPFALALPRAKMFLAADSGCDLNTDKEEGRMMPAGVTTMLMAIFASVATQAVCWTFAESAAQHLHMRQSEVTTAFTTMALAQIPAALGAAWLGTRFGYRIPILVGCMASVLIAFGMYNSDSRVLFLISTISLSPTGAFLFPYLQGLLAEMDESGTSAAAGGAVANLAAAAGPAISALFFSLGGLRFIGFSAAGLIVICLGCALIGVSLFTRAREMRVA